MFNIKHIKCMLFIWSIMMSCITNNIFAQSQSTSYLIASATDKYHYNKSETPGGLIEVRGPGNGTYQWEVSDKPEIGFTVIANAVGKDLIFSQMLTSTKYYRRKTTRPFLGSSYSNTIKLTLVSDNWEDLNYVREYAVRVPGKKTADEVLALPVGQKMQATTYTDGMDRQIQTVLKDAAAPAEGTSLWGDVVQIFQYDAFERQTKNYKPYSTASHKGKFKAAPLLEQEQYYQNAYGETSAFSTVRYESSMLERVVNSKAAGTAWAAGNGTSITYETNNVNENVQKFSDAFDRNVPPAHNGVYAPNTLFKLNETDENGKRTISYLNKEGLVVLKKIQIDDNPSMAHSGWICTYYVYDVFGLLIYTIQPEGVKYLDANNWSFAGINGAKILDEQCFQYRYDKHGRNTWKKVPGAVPLKMLYDLRNRVVFTQDGNQAGKIPGEWTVTLYDELDRTTMTALYRTDKTEEEMQKVIDDAVIYYSASGPVPPPSKKVEQLVVNNRVTSISRYTATKSIEFVQPFESAIGDNFVAEIEEGAEPIVDFTLLSPISETELQNTSICTIIKYEYYDNYTFAGVKSFDPAFENSSAYAGSEPAVEPMLKSSRTIGFQTGAKVRVLGTNTFLTTTTYYDEEGRPLQSIKDNIKAGTDITTLQYHFDGRLLSSHEKHTTTNTGYTNFSTLTKNVYDILGRLSSIQKKYGANPFKTIASYEYEDMGRLKKKILAPGYTGAGKTELETLEYSYNINDHITGINKDYALKTPGKYDKWEHFFGLYLGYDNRDNVFNKAELEGRVTGMLWTSQGDDVQRKFDFTYDHSGRLTNAFFNERKELNDVWSNNKIDFSSSGRNGKIEYDLNGNLLYLLQKGVVPGAASPVIIDDLEYTYASFSNKLLRVTDNSTLGAQNGKFGDFKDGVNSGTDDYVYDENGNLVVDLNKNIKDLPGLSGGHGIRYNFLDKPEEINIPDKGKITIVYDGDGNRLQRTFTPIGSSNTVTTTYIRGYVYKGDELQYINFEEGRIRIIQPVSESNGLDMLSITGNMPMPGNKSGVFDYFILDYQKNVRMILTEEAHIGSNQCTMETARATGEEAVFGQNGSTNEVQQTRFAAANIPGQGVGGGWDNTQIGSQVSRLGKLAGHTTGPNALMKVMAGDEISATTLYYYKSPVVNNSNGAGLITDVISSLAQSILGSSIANGNVKAAASNISSNLAGSTPFSSMVAPDAANASGNNPKAYLTVLFFDERFNFVGESSSSLRVSQADVNNASLTLADLKAPKNGYAYAYLSNESDEMVYFDNFNVAHKRGHIVEENHFYAYGLRMEGISSRKLGDPVAEGHLANNNLYNDKELWDDADLNWYDYGFRNYDPQIGRFTQLDPFADSYTSLTPYQYAGCEPIANVDVDGLEPAAAIAFAKLMGRELAKVGTKWVVTYMKAGAIVARTFKPAVVATTVSTAVSVANMLTTIGETALDMTPVVGSVIDIYNGVKTGNGWQLAAGIGGLALDVLSFGTASILKGAGKGIVKASIGAVKKSTSLVTKVKVLPGGSKIAKFTGGIGEVGEGAVKTVNSSAHLATEGANLSKHLGQLEKYGQDGFKELQNGRFRYYGNVTPASTPGEMIGRRVVREWNPTTGGTRTWMETLDGAGSIRIVRPETGGTKVHFMFDKFGNFMKKW